VAFVQYFIGIYYTLVLLILYILYIRIVFMVYSNMSVVFWPLFSQM